MAYPTISAQQEINNRKILKDLQINKQLLEKGVVPGITSAVPNLNMPSFVQSQTQQQTEFTLNSSTLRPTQAWTQATNNSFGFFVPQDSLFGNTILPVLPRVDNQSK
ncbi:SOSS complex subunit C like [Pseudolycoriella hygida]|uniref:SOSS complex subunit C like n=1 Tax=Pseudolycoriella hygida TaxID=35572 RepID=A0A9Q0RZA8_9DIPT|nr:SOSS complex subunit C like [Pseudolycoriella hygida]